MIDPLVCLLFHFIVSAAHFHTVGTGVLFRIRVQHTQHMENVIDFIEFLRLRFPGVHQFHKTGDDGDIEFGGKEIGATLGRAGLSVIEPHLLLRVNEYSLSPIGSLPQQFQKIRIQIVDIPGQRDSIGVVHQVADDALHGKIGHLAHNAEFFMEDGLGKLADGGILQRAEMVAGDHHPAGDLRQIFRPHDLHIPVDDPGADAGDDLRRERLPPKPQMIVVLLKRIGNLGFLCVSQNRIVQFHLCVEIPGGNRLLDIGDHFATVLPYDHNLISTPD